MSNFTLHFESTLKPQQLGRDAGEKDSLEGTLMQDCEYENVMFNPEEPVLPCVFEMKKLYLDCHLVRGIKFIRFVCYLYVCVY